MRDILTMYVPYFIEDFLGGDLGEVLGVVTNNRGAKDEWDTGAGFLVDLREIGTSMLRCNLCAHDSRPSWGAGSDQIGRR